MKAYFERVKSKLMLQRALLKFRILSRLLDGYSLHMHMARELPLSELDAAKIVCFIKCGAGSSLIKLIDRQVGMKKK